MKVFAHLFLLSLASAAVMATVEGDIPSLFEQNEAALDQYLDLLSSQYVDEIIAKNDKDSEALQANPDSPVSRKLGLASGKPKTNLKTVKMHPKKITPQERRLYESLTSSYLIGSNDDSSTTNHLSLLMAQQKSMQNMRTISAWLNDIENNLDDMRDAINRRVADLATGLQRRNMLLSHYNNAGLVGRG